MPMISTNLRSGFVGDFVKRVMIDEDFGSDFFEVFGIHFSKFERKFRDLCSSETFIPKRWEVNQRLELFCRLCERIGLCLGLDIVEEKITECERIAMNCEIVQSFENHEQIDEDRFHIVIAAWCDLDEELDKSVISLGIVHGFTIKWEQIVEKGRMIEQADLERFVFADGILFDTSSI